MALQDRELNSNHLNRPRKGTAEKRRRQRLQLKRLVALGVPETRAKALDPRAVRLLLRRPNRVAKALHLK
jgi:hypothetical protein